MTLPRQRYDWRKFAPRNKGPIMVEKDFNYPGGYYVRHKNAKFCICGTRWDIESLVENAIAALEENCGRLLLNNEADKTCIEELKGIILEGLDKHMLAWLEAQGVNNAFIKKQFFMELLWKLLADIRVNERAPFYEIDLGEGKKLTMKDLMDNKQKSVAMLDIFNSFNR